MSLKQRLGWSAPLLIVGVLMAMAFVNVQPQGYKYSYDVKMQQVYDNDRIKNAETIKFEDLNAKQHSVLYRAFKNVETGTLLGETSAESTVTFQEKNKVFSDWIVVEFKGVYLLTAVEEPRKMPVYTPVQWAWMLITGFAAFFSVTVGLGVFFDPPEKHERVPSNTYRDDRF